MSHALGIIFSREETPIIIGYFEYDGTADLVLPQIHRTAKEVHDNWRKGDWVKCSCGQPSIPCWLYNEYGRGSYWAGDVCIRCRAVTSPLAVETLWELGIDSKDGRPDGKPTTYDIIMSGHGDETYCPDGTHPDWNA